MDFGMLPPEINSGRMYAGPRSGPMLAAAAAWDELATQLHAAAASYNSVISALSGVWQGPSSAAMVAAAAPYSVWMSATAVQAEQTAAQARAAAAAFENAFAATVPPPVVAANRVLLMSLIATNFFGQNTPAIAATEAHYAEMWAQDAAAMFGYASSSAAASRVTPFAEPPQTTNSAALAGQSAAVAHATGTAVGTQVQTLPHLISAVPQALQSLAVPASSAAADASPPSSLASSLNTIASFWTGSVSPFSYFTIAGVPYLLGFQSYLLPQAGVNLAGVAGKASAVGSASLLESSLGAGTHMLASTGLGGGAVSAGIGRAGVIGGLSVPQGWATAAPAVRTAAAVMPQTQLGVAPAAFADTQGNLFSNMALSGLAGRALTGTAGSAARSVGISGGVTPAAPAVTANIFVIPEAGK
ncbi:PPE family protein [Mycobacterium botniense]|uniref:Putative PPE family protein PPE29 n=1 Tax=Mycobacterium botniense TaxID=84962 RepID=A0A7I9Y1Q2_9MYCO|nr:PPE family protein [Mycobacterium botniense]GFG75999.1 putative PPE family protein PPE29 [Mycobacterium botniense]